MDEDVRLMPSPAHGQEISRHEPQPQSQLQTSRAFGTGAEPAVISSILSSLETDTLTPLPESSDFYTDSANRRASHTRHRSSELSTSSRKSVRRVSSSPGFGVEYGRGLALDDEDGLSDAALSPTVPTSRPASALSNNASHIPRASSFSSKSKLKPRSRTASIVARRGPGISRQSSLSALSTKSVETSVNEERAHTQKILASEEALEKVQEWISGKGDDSPKDNPTAPSYQYPERSEELPSLSLAEQIIARHNAQISAQSSKRQEGDANTHITKEQRITSLTIPSPSPQASPQSERCTSGTASSTPGAQISPSHTRPPSGAASAIADSVPTRTSSLRHSAGSTSRRKSRKSRKVTMARSASSYKSSDVIPDSKWLDLGDEDQTVRRIKQLREQRKSRLHERTVFEQPAEASFENVKDQDAQIAELPAELPNDLVRQASPSRRLSNRTVATRSSPVETSTPSREPMRAQMSAAKASIITPSRAEIGMRKHSLDSQRPFSAQRSPTPSDFSSLQPLSLDYSYSDAVDAFPGAAYHAIGDPGDRSVTSSPAWPQDLDVSGSPKHPSRTATPTKSKSIKLQKSPLATAGKQSEVLVESAKKEKRRKSMGDARMPRNLENAPEMPRRDSVEGAVAAFLAAPRLNQKLKRADTGRVISFSEVGDPEGAAVFVCVGMGLTRYVTAFYDELAATLRLRLITLDRPGVGGSEPYPSSDKSGPLGWADDVSAICGHLRISQFSLLAHSAGAVYALATALVYPQMIKGSVHLLAPWIPPSQLEAISYAETAPPSNPLPRSQRFLRVIPAPFLKAANTSFISATSASLKPVKREKTYSNRKTSQRQPAPEVVTPQRPVSSYTPEYNRRESMMLMDQYMPEMNPLEAWPLVNGTEDRPKPPVRRSSLTLSATAVPTDPSFTYASIALNAAEHTESQRKSDYTSLLTQRTWDLATRDSNPATDLLVCLERHRDVGFRYTDVSRDMIITHGTDDRRVPLANVRWLADQINRRALSQSLEALARERRRSSWAEPKLSPTRCEVRILPGEGHGLMASPTIMGDVLEEIAGYWRGQNRRMG